MRPLPEHSAYWGKPPQTKDGDSDADILYLPIGRALTNWEQVEEECAVLFSLLVDSFSEAAYRAYGCIIATSTKSEMLKSAAETFFGMKSISEDHSKPFYDLMKHYQAAATRRNEIAHGRVIGYIEFEEVRRFQFFLVPPEYNSRKIHPRNPVAIDTPTFYRAKYCYVAKDIEHFGLRFRELHSWVHEYSDFLSRNYCKWP
jgi:hypothetical protein